MDITSAEVLELLLQTKKDLENSPLYLRVQELESLYKEIQDYEYTQRLERQRDELLQKGYRCTHGHEVILGTNFKGHSSIYNYLIVEPTTPDISSIEIDTKNDEFVTFKNSNKVYLNSVVVSYSDEELDAWSDAYFKIITRRDGY